VGTESGIFSHETDGLAMGARTPFKPVSLGKFPLPAVRRMFAEGGKLRYIVTAGKGVYVYKEESRREVRRQGVWLNYSSRTTECQ